MHVTVHRSFSSARSRTQKGMNTTHKDLLVCSIPTIFFELSWLSGPNTRQSAFGQFLPDRRQTYTIPATCRSPASQFLGLQTSCSPLANIINTNTAERTGGLTLRNGAVLKITSPHNALSESYKTLLRSRTPEVLCFVKGSRKVTSVTVVDSNEESNGTTQIPPITVTDTEPFGPLGCNFGPIEEMKDALKGGVYMTSQYRLWGYWRPDGQFAKMSNNDQDDAGAFEDERNEDIDRPHGANLRILNGQETNSHYL
jgi:hypothetical protein